MNKCFITKLPSSVDNDNLPVLGQLRINWLKQSDLADNYARAIGLSTNDSITVKVSGAHLTDNTLASNLGNTKTITATDGLVWLYVSNDADATITIDNKYALTSINVVKSGSKESSVRSIYFDIEDIKYCTALSYLDLSNTQVSGDINAVSKLTNLTSCYLDNTQVSGDISALSSLTNIVHMHLFNTQVSGNINVISNLISLNTVGLNNTQVSGDINAVSKLTNLTELRLSNTQVSGKVDSLANLTKLTYLNKLNGLALTGDISKLPANAYWLSLSNRKVSTNFTWTANGRKNVTLIGMGEEVPFDTTSMDNMFIDQATCTVNAAASWEKMINVKGTRTSASDAAVTAIQNMGVTIIGVTKQA